MAVYKIPEMKSKPEQNLGEMLSTKGVHEKKPKTESKLKRKLFVLKKDGHFFISHAAARSLGIAKTRAIMVNNPNMIEIDAGTLLILQNDESIEIEYTNQSKGIDAKKYQTDLSTMLDGLESGEYGIGIHGIDKGSIEEKGKKAETICEDGVDITNNSKTILSTSISLGANEDSQEISQEIENYRFGNGSKMNVVLAVPLCIQNENGEKIFLGFPEQNKRTAGQQYEEHCILDRICSQMRRIPPQFVLGYYRESSDGGASFVPNEQHYSNLSQEERETLFREISSNMDDISRNYNDLIARADIDKLTELRNKMQQLGMKPYLAENSMNLAKKYREKTLLQDRIPKRKVLVNHDSPPRETSTSDSQERKKKTILIGAAMGVRRGDLIEGKSALKEGMNKERNQENKNLNDGKGLNDE